MEDVMWGGSKFEVVTITITILLILVSNAFAQEQQQCVPSSCGHIHNISYPFRLNTDPKHCGANQSFYELRCEGNRTIFTYYNYEYGANMVRYVKDFSYVVEAINHGNSTIRLADPGITKGVICSLPKQSVRPDDIPIFGAFRRVTAREITIFSCPTAYLSSPPAVEITNCLNMTTSSSGTNTSDFIKGHTHTFATMAKFLVSDLEVGCTVNVMSLSSWHIHEDHANANIISNAVDMHNAFAYGFEISWFADIHCDQCYAINYHCQGENLKDVRCVEPTPTRITRCYYNFRFFKIHCNNTEGHQRHIFRKLTKIIPWLIPISVQIIVIRALLLPCIFVFLVIRFRRRHLSTFDAIESFLHGENNFKPIRYPYSKIKEISRNFEN